MSSQCVRVILFVVTAQLLWTTSADGKNLVDSIFRNPYEKVNEHASVSTTTVKVEVTPDENGPVSMPTMIEAPHNVPDKPCRPGTRRDGTTMVCRPVWI